MLRQGGDSGPDVVRVAVAFHRFANGGSTNLPKARYAQEDHTFLEGGVLACLSRNAKVRERTSIFTNTEEWLTLAAAGSDVLCTRVGPTRIQGLSFADLNRTCNSVQRVRYNTLYSIDRVDDHWQKMQWGPVEAHRKNWVDRGWMPVNARYLPRQEWGVLQDAGSGVWVRGLAKMQAAGTVLVEWCKGKVGTIRYKYAQYDAVLECDDGRASGRVSVSRRVQQLSNHGAYATAMTNTKFFDEPALHELILEFLCDPNLLHPDCIVQDAIASHEWEDGVDPPAHYLPLSAVRPQIPMAYIPASNHPVCNG